MRLPGLQVHGVTVLPGARALMHTTDGSTFEVDSSGTMYKLAVSAGSAQGSSPVAGAAGRRKLQQLPSLSGSTTISCTSTSANCTKISPLGNGNYLGYVRTASTTSTNLQSASLWGR